MRYTHERAPAADARKSVRVVRRNNTTNNNNERGVVETSLGTKRKRRAGFGIEG